MNIAIKQPNGVSGYKDCPAWLHKLYRSAVKFICQGCHEHEDQIGKLQPHRTKRKTHGGLYTVCKLSDKRNNVQVVCSKCHNKFHENEYNWCQGK